MNEWTQIAVAVLALGGPLLAYLLAARKASGRIRSSDATELWEEAREIRHDYAARLVTLEARNKELSAEVDRLNRENMRLSASLFKDGGGRDA